MVVEETESFPSTLSRLHCMLSLTSDTILCFPPSRTVQRRSGGPTRIREKSMHFELMMPSSPPTTTPYRLDLATRSNSLWTRSVISTDGIENGKITTHSFFLIAYELEDPLEALMISSAKTSLTLLTFRKADSRVYRITKSVRFERNYVDE